MRDLNDILSSLSEISKQQIDNIFKLIPGPKDLILEPKIIKPLERICGVSWLKINDVDRIYKLEPKITFGQNSQVFLIYTNYKTFKVILDLIQSYINENVTKVYHIICVPKYLYAFEEHIEELGLLDVNVKLYSLQWFPILIDLGLLSLEIPNMYKSVFVNQDYSLLPIYAKSLWHLQSSLGPYKFVLGLGKYSNIVLDQFNMYDKTNFDQTEVSFSGLILMDRSIDYTSTLLTPSTYSALLKDIYSIQGGVCEHKGVGSEEKYDDKLNPIINKQDVKFILDSNRDEVYDKIKNLYFTEVTAVLSTLTKQLKAEKDTSRNINQIKQYIKTQLQAATSTKKNISNHLIAAESIITSLSHKFEGQIHVERNILQNKNKSSCLKFLEEMTQMDNDRYSSLRLMCLMAVAENISDNDCKSFLDKYFLEFGYGLGCVYRNLINTNFINLSDSESFSSKIKKVPLISYNNFYSNLNKIKQIPPNPDKVNLKNPNCCSYVFGGYYIPLISQICSLILSSTPLEEIKAKLSSLGLLNIFNPEVYPLQKKVLLVCLIGGITYSEIAALKLLEHLTGSTIVVLSDTVISGNDVCEALIAV